MTIPAVHCEARKVAYRQTRDGLVVSFVIHPNDMPNALAVAPLGTRYMLALAQIGDDEQPVSPAGAHLEKENARLSGNPPAGEPSRSAAMKERYASSSEMEKALTRAATYCKDRRFQDWAVRRLGNGVTFGSEDDAALYIREVCCDGESRKLIAEDHECYRRFIKLETEFLMDIGMLARPQ